MFALLLPVLLAVASANPVNTARSASKGYAYAFDLIPVVSQSTFSCIKKEGYEAIFVRAYNPTGNGAYDPNAGTNILNAYKAGLGTEVYVTPQPLSTKTAAQQVDEFYRGISGSGVTVRTVWFQVTSPINWSKNTTTNRSFISGLLQKATSLSLNLGLYTNVYDWNQITGGWTSPPYATHLWYWSILGNGPTGESPATFDDFRAFGAWTNPSVKQFGQSESVCGVTGNRDIYPASVTIVKNVVMENGKIVVGGNIVA